VYAFVSSDAYAYFHPILAEYNSTAYAGLETAIFPHYFHGKCLDAHGNEPNGCPNPDCPIVCGTPGSLVHFYHVLRQIVFDQTREILVNITDPKTKAYKAVEKAVLDDIKTAGLDRRASRGLMHGVSRVYKKRQTSTYKAQLRSIIKGFSSELETTCGTNLTHCSWETEMKKFVLQFP